MKAGATEASEELRTVDHRRSGTHLAPNGGGVSLDGRFLSIWSDKTGPGAMYFRVGGRWVLLPDWVANLVRELRS